MQGLGEGPDRVLAGGRNLYLLEREDSPQHVEWTMDRTTGKGYPRVRCMAATDEIIIMSGYDGTLEILRMDTPLGQLGPPTQMAL
jgi:hypothetical protein